MPIFSKSAYIFKKRPRLARIFVKAGSRSTAAHIQRFLEIAPFAFAWPEGVVQRRSRLLGMLAILVNLWNWLNFRKFRSGLVSRGVSVVSESAVILTARGHDGEAIPRCYSVRRLALRSNSIECYRGRERQWNFDFAWVVCETWKTAEWAVVLAEKFLNSGDAWVVSDTVIRTDLSQKREARSFKKPRKLALSAERLDRAEVVSRKSKAAFIVTAVTRCVCVQSSCFLVWETTQR